MNSFIEFTGTARLDRRTKHLVRRLGPDDIAIIDHTDLDRVSAEEVEAEAAQLGFLAEPHRLVPESEQYLGSTIVVLRKLSEPRESAGG